MWKWIRLSMLMMVFTTVSAEAYLQKVLTTSWENTIKVVVYPVASGASEQVSQYIAGLKDDDFNDVEDFMQEQAIEYMMSDVRPVEVVLGPVVDDMPPAMPEYGGPLENMWFSLKLRAWVEKYDSTSELGNIRMFAVFHDPDNTAYLPHSVGLQKGLMGVVHGYADAGQQGTNNFVLTHELLHTFGASDKYDPHTNLPLYPTGYSMPNKVQLYPQKRAEIMGGRIPLDSQTAEIPHSLAQSRIGGQTAWEINWIR